MWQNRVVTGVTRIARTCERVSRIPAQHASRSVSSGLRISFVQTCRAISTSFRTSSPGSAQALAIKADELFKEALSFVNLDHQEEAERALESAISLLGKSHNVSAALSEGQVIEDPVLAHYFAILAFTKQSLEKFEEADTLYRATLTTLSKTLWKNDDKQLGVALMNHAEVQAQLRQFAEAKKSCEEAARILKANFGATNEIYATAMSNLSAYNCQLGLYKEAKPICREALKVMMDLLGRDNDLTKSCWSNYHIILKKLNLKDEIQDLETEWKAASETGGWMTGDRPVPPQVMENLKKKLEERLTPPAPLDVGGFVKDPSFAKMELEKFVEEAKKKGLSPDDPAFLDVLEHEVNAIMDGKHKSEEALQAATQHVSEMADKMGPEWRRFVEQILVVAPSLDEAASSIQQAGGLDPEFVAQEQAAIKAEAEHEKVRQETLARGAEARAEKAHIIEEQRRRVEADTRGSQFDE